MALTVFDICEELRPYVKAICAMEISEQEAVSGFRVLPDTCVEMFISYRNTQLANIHFETNDIYSGSIITYRMSQYMDVRMLKGSACMAVCFNPGYAACFIPHTVGNGIIALSDALDAIGKEMEEQIALAKDNRERNQLLQQYLVQMLRFRQPADATVSYCLWQAHLFKGRLTVNELADKAGLSQRQLSRRFHNALAIGPKEYLRVSRFLHSLKTLKQEEYLTSLAYEHGYYDQAHFIHEYRTFAGLTPSELRNATNVLY
jgi:AraC-like DNA-binding protein